MDPYLDIIKHGKLSRLQERRQHGAVEFHDYESGSERVLGAVLARQARLSKPGRNEEDAVANRALRELAPGCVCGTARATLFKPVLNLHTHGFSLRLHRTQEIPQKQGCGLRLL